MLIAINPSKSLILLDFYPGIIVNIYSYWPESLSTYPDGRMEGFCLPVCGHLATLIRTVGVHVGMGVRLRSSGKNMMVSS